MPLDKENRRKSRRFVLLRHDMPSNSERASHFDLMLESEGQLKTWALERIPRLGECVEALHLTPHRIEYLQYEGDVCGNRGSVRRIDQGRYTIVQSNKRSLMTAIAGKQLFGYLEFIRCGESRGESQCWLIKRTEDLASL